MNVDSSVQEHKEMASLGGRSRPAVATQALIVTNCVVDPNIVINRQQMAARAPHNSTIIGKSAINAEQLQIEEGELLLSHITPFQFSGKAMSTRRALVFSSFNGIPIEDGISQDAFEDQFMFIGMAHTTTFPEGDPGGMQNGISAKRAGSGTTLNNSSDTFAPGDLIGFRLPSVDKDQRAREVASHSAGRVGTDRWRQNKHVAILKKITYKDIISQFDLAVAELLDNNAGISVHQHELISAGGHVATLSSTQEIAVLTKKAYNWAYWSAIQTAVEQGYVTLTGNVNGTTDNEKMLSLAAMLGLIKSSVGIGEEYEMEERYYRRALKGSLSYTSTAMQVLANEQLEQDLYNLQTRAAPSFGQSGKFGNVAEQLIHIANTASKDLTKAYGHSLDRIQHKIIGTSSCFAAPQASIDYALRP